MFGTALLALDKGYYASTIDGDDVDASDLLLIILTYLGRDSPRAKSHLSYLEKHLKAGDSLLYLYKHQDDFGSPESAFLVCSFWYIETLVCVGRVEDAIKAFDQVRGYSNALGLFSEDVSPGEFSEWGNCPQTYSHSGLINDAFRIAKRLDTPYFF